MMIMKLISLNTWGGRIFGPLSEFIRKHRDTADIFCFQEIFSSDRRDMVESRNTRIHLLDEIQSLLPDYSSHFYPVQDGFDEAGKIDFPISTGQATFVQKKHAVIESGRMFTHKERNSATGNGFGAFPSNIVYVRVRMNDTPLSILNFHGIAEPGNKRDTPERIAQSKKILDFLKTKHDQIILAGDFNLMPDTQSIRMIEKHLMNLISKFSITTTRSALSPWHGTKDQQDFADYTFCSPSVRVARFTVPREELISDHLPMILEIAD